MLSVVILNLGAIIGIVAGFNLWFIGARRWDDLALTGTWILSAAALVCCGITLEVRQEAVLHEEADLVFLMTAIVAGTSVGVGIVIGGIVRLVVLTVRR